MSERCEELERVLTNIVLNARMQPDASMGGAADCWAVPLDDIDAAIIALLKPETPEPFPSQHWHGG
jgi:hypothetical protein